MDKNDLTPLTKEEIEEKLKDSPGWEYKEDKISKQFTFKEFDDTVAFITKLAPFCNKMDHHPDIHIFYNKILFELQRFDVGSKVTERDFSVAKEIERLYSL